MAQTKPTLLYFGDPMCSWCYGFSPEFNNAMMALDEKVDVQLIMGGLRPYNRETMKDLSGFLKGHWEEVHERSSQPFQYGILEEENMYYDTEPSCRAVVTVRQMNPAIEFAFFKAVQQSFYFKNNDPNLTETFVNLAGAFDLDKNEFRQLFESDEMKVKVRQDFEHSAEMGVRGFPTVLLQKGEELFLLSNGYVKAGNIVEKVEQVLKN
ncbi:MAG: DsbA family protein [Bacteroidota bacterium]